MKKWILSALATFMAVLFFGICGNAQSYTIKGEIKDANKPKLVYLYSDIRSDTVAVAPVVNGEFLLTGKINSPEPVTLQSEPRGFSVELVLEEGAHSIIINDSRNANIQNAGKLTNMVFGFINNPEYHRTYKEWYDASGVRIKNELDENEVKEKRKMLLGLLRKHFSVITDFQDSVLATDMPEFSRYFLKTIRFESDPKVMQIVDTFYAKFPNTDYARLLKERYERYREIDKKQAEVATGKRYRDIEVVTRGGKKVKLSEVVAKNKYTLLDFWASWCGPCRGEFPHLREAYKKYKDKGFEIYAVSLDDTREAWIKASDQEKLPWMDLFETGGFNGKSASSYTVTGIPATYLISKDGIIVASDYGARGFELARKLEEVFK